MTYNMVGYSILYEVRLYNEVRLAIYDDIHMTLSSMVVGTLSCMK